MSGMHVCEEKWHSLDHHHWRNPLAINTHFPLIGYADYLTLAIPYSSTLPTVTQNCLSSEIERETEPGKENSSILLLFGLSKFEGWLGARQGTRVCDYELPSWKLARRRANPPEWRCYPVWSRVMTCAVHFFTGSFPMSQDGKSKQHAGPKVSKWTYGDD